MLPLVSVLMPIRNEQAFIVRSLGAVLAQDYPPDRLEVLVADGMSDDNTRRIIQALPGIERVRVIQNPNRRQAAGLNLALREARGEVIVRVDGHTVIAPDYVRQCVEALRRTGAANVGGMMTAVGTSPVGQAIAAAASSAFAVPSAFRVSHREQTTDSVYMGAWPRVILEQVRGFNEAVGVNEDYELNYRIRQQGGKILLSPAICSEYYGRETLPALGRQFFQYGKSKARMVRQHPASFRVRQLVAPAFVLALGIGPLFPPVRAFWLGLLATYALLNLVFSVRVSRRAGVNIGALLVIFPAIHVSWGLGFLVGLCRA